MAVPPSPPAPPKRPPGLASGRWLDDLSPLNPAEMALVDACKRGKRWEPAEWDRKRPTGATNANTIRADVIRFLLLGGDTGHPVHEEGVMLRGAWITGELNLHQARCAARLDAKRCYFVEKPVLTAAHLPQLVLSGSRVPGLTADRLTTTGTVFLRDKFEAEGEVRLLGAEIGGSLECSGGSFKMPLGDALCADRIKVTGGVNLDGGFTAEGEVRLLGAEIGGDLQCSGGSFKLASGDALSADDIKVTGSVSLGGGFSAEGVVRLLGAEIGGDLQCSGDSFEVAAGYALNADRIKVTGNVNLGDGFTAEGEVLLLAAEIGGDLDCSGGSFEVTSGDALIADGLRLTGRLFLRDASISGGINLATARIGTLADGDLTMWQSGGHFLDGFRYDRIFDVTDADRRIAWLRQQRGTDLTSAFKPQPWEQLIKVLRDMGHPYDAGEVAIAKQEQLRAAGKIKGSVRQALHGLYGAFTGYGYRPLRLIYSAGVIWFVASLLYAHAAAIGIMAPSNAEIIAHRQLHSDLRGAVADSGACGVRGEVQPENFWPQCPALPSEYTTFYSFAYSLDLILPLVDLQQERDWAPAVSYTDARGTVRNSVAGQLIRAVLWFEILFGWTASLVLVAVLTRLVEKD